MQHLQQPSLIKRVGIYSAIIFTLVVVLSLTVIVATATFIHQIFLLGVFALFMLPIGVIYYISKGYDKVRSFVTACWGMRTYKKKGITYLEAMHKYRTLRSLITPSDEESREILNEAYTKLLEVADQYQISATQLEKDLAK